MPKHDKPKAPQTKTQNQSDKQSIRTVEYGYSFSGPLPPPDVLAGYENILPGATDRILSMAENQSQHRQRIEKRVINSDTRNSTLGLIFGLIIGLSGIFSGAYLIYKGQELMGGLFAAGTIGSLVTTFVYGSRQRRNERSEKS